MMAEKKKPRITWVDVASKMGYYDPYLQYVYEDEFREVLYEKGLYYDECQIHPVKGTAYNRKKKEELAKAIDEVLQEKGNDV